MPTPNLTLRAYQAQDLPAIVTLFQASVSQLTAPHYDAAPGLGSGDCRYACLENTFLVT
ncbi:hypothetical protein N1078_10370 [Pseudomonas sp. MIL19]|uniref:hypothetical protein n=1 Tax=Pseudomonas sp. MIL19 TaxID=2976979 RepID=UPI002363EDBD|nr:hypothetical protein [Pseudomonas sp. MIL19]MDD2160981.1 hypothetical protein [Pseudomonas sp. MIL19]